MKTEELSRTSVVLIEAAGLSITALAVLVIAFVVQLVAALLSGGAFQPSLGPLSFSVAFYLIGCSVVYATRQQPDLGFFACANTAVQAGFVGAGWLLFLADRPVEWLGRAVAFIALVNGANWGFARLRTAFVQRLLERVDARPSAAVERCFFSPPFAYLALPFGAALGTLASTVLAQGAPPRHALAGVAVAFAFVALKRAFSDALHMAGDLVTEHDEATTRIEAVSSGDRFQLRLCAPAAANTDVALRARAADAAGHIRYVLMVNQLQRATLFSIACLVFTRLELDIAPGLSLLAALLGFWLLLAQGACWLGRLKSGARAKRGLSGAQRKELGQRLSEQPHLTPLSRLWAALSCAGALAYLSFSAIEPLLAQLLR